jgi:hypothetical protein
MHKFTFLCLLLLTSMGPVVAQRLTQVLAALPPLPNTGDVLVHAREDTVARKFAFDVVKPDALAVDRIEVVSGHHHQTLKRIQWVDAWKDNMEGAQFLVPLVNTDEKRREELFIRLYSQKELIRSYRLEQRLPCGVMYMDFFGLVN